MKNAAMKSVGLKSYAVGEDAERPPARTKKGLGARPCPNILVLTLGLSAVGSQRRNLFPRCFLFPRPFGAFSFQGFELDRPFLFAAHLGQGTRDQGGVHQTLVADVAVDEEGVT